MDEVWPAACLRQRDEPVESQEGQARLAGVQRHAGEGGNRARLADVLADELRIGRRRGEGGDVNLA